MYLCTSEEIVISFAVHVWWVLDGDALLHHKGDDVTIEPRKREFNFPLYTERGEKRVEGREEIVRRGGRRGGRTGRRSTG